jgi:aspartate ammonia-lyase
VGIVTALVPVLGYERSTELARQAYETDRGILQILREEKVLTDAQIEELLDPAKLTGLDREQYRSATQR